MEEKRNYVVYKHTSPSGKVYIGITCQNPERRWRRGQGYIDNYHFIRAINKYGWDKFTHEILFENLTLEEAGNKEKELIKFYDATNPNKGYNISEGGINPKFAESSKIKFKETYRKKAKSICKYSLEGKLIETYDSCSDAIEQNNFSKHANGKIFDVCNKHVTKEGIRSWTYKGYQWRYFEETFGEDIDPINEAMYQPPIRYVEVVEIDEDGNLIKTFDSIKECEAYYGINRVTSICKRQYTIKKSGESRLDISTHGKYFMYKQDFEDIEKLQEYIQLIKKSKFKQGGYNVILEDENHNLIKEFSSKTKLCEYLKDFHITTLQNYYNVDKPLKLKNGDYVYLKTKH